MWVLFAVLFIMVPISVFLVCYGYLEGNNINVILGIILSVLVFILVFHYENEPTAIDVYRGKTTLEITYKDSVAVDSVVVFK